MQERIEFGLKALGAVNFRALCQEYGISTKTGYKWKERFLCDGIRGMVERSRRPKSHADQLAEQTVCEIIRLKLAPWELGSAQDPGTLSTPSWRGSQREQL